MVMDSPVILYAESLGASATVIGLIQGITPLMVVFQIPAADHVGRVGYKRFITTGWTLRLVFVLPLIAVPLLSGVLNPQSQLALVIGALIGFNLVRGSQHRVVSMDHWNYSGENPRPLSRSGDSFQQHR